MPIEVNYQITLQICVNYCPNWMNGKRLASNNFNITIDTHGKIKNNYMKHMILLTTSTFN